MKSTTKILDRPELKTRYDDIPNGDHVAEHGGSLPGPLSGKESKPKPSPSHTTRKCQGGSSASKTASDSSKGKSSTRKCQGGYLGTKLATLKRKFQKRYYFSDTDIIDVVLGVVAGNHFDSDPIWLHLISPPSGGKTELLNSISTCDETYLLSDFTAATLISGYREPDDDEKDHSLLPKLNGKVVVTKDFSVIHSKPREMRAQILSILRDVYDGHGSRGFGNQDRKSYKSKFNFLTGMTPDIEHTWSLSTLGERFLMYRISIKNRREHARRSLQNANASDAIRDELQEAVKEFIDCIPHDGTPSVDQAMVERILDLADLLSTCRTYVQRERSDAVDTAPQAELASRVSRQLLRLGQSVALVRGKQSVTDDEFEIMKRVAFDSLPTNRRAILAALWKCRVVPHPLADFEKMVTTVSKTTVQRLIEDLYRLDVLNKTTKGRTNHYKLKLKFREYFRNIGGISSC